MQISFSKESTAQEPPQIISILATGIAKGPLRFCNHYWKVQIADKCNAYISSFDPCSFLAILILAFIR